MADSDKVLVEVEFGVDTRAADQKAAKFQKGLAAQLQRIGKAAEALGKINERVTKDASDDTKEWVRQLGTLTKYHQNEIKEVENLDEVVRGLRKDQAKAGGEEQKRLEGQIRSIQAQAKERKKGLGKSVKNSLGFDPNKVGSELKDSLGKAASGFKSSMTSFFAKDVKGLGNNFAGIFSKDVMKGLGKASKLRGYKMMMGGALTKDRGAALMAKPGGSFKEKAQGAGLKAMGSVMGGVGKIMGLLGKILPIIGAVSSAIVGVVKLFLDADANVKDFNKSILESAGTGETLYANMGDVTDAAVDMKATLKDIQKSSEEWGYQNAWGIMREDHVKILNTLNQEGVALEHMKQEAKVAGMGVGKFTQELAKVSMAYSKAFGVPLAEINQFQAEMMTEMGMSLDGVRMQFENMARSATESGIASNKFFAIIKGVSQDLSLYNVRMESAVKMLKMLGKVMNPRNAAKFMQTASQGMKAMSQDDRLKVALLTGDKGKAIVAKDLENKRTNLYKDIGGAIGAQASDVEKRLNDPSTAKDLWAELERKNKGKFGALKESHLELGIDTAASKKGPYGQAMAMENMGMGGSLDMASEAIRSLTGKKTLMEGAGDLGMTKTAEMLGYSTEQLRGMMKLEVAVQEQKDALLKQGKKELGEAKDEKSRQAAQHKIDIATSGGTQDILDSMSEEEQKSLKDGTKSQEQWAKEQVKQTDSIINQLERLLQFLMNQVYSAISGIYEVVASFSFGDSDAKKMYKIQQQIMSMKEGSEKTALMKKLSDTAGQSATERLGIMSAEMSGSAAEGIRGSKAGLVSKEGLDDLKWVFEAGFDKVAKEDPNRVAAAAKKLGVDESNYGTQAEFQQALQGAHARQSGARVNVEKQSEEKTAAVDKAFKTQAASGVTGLNAISALADLEDSMRQSQIGHESQGDVNKALAMVATGADPSKAMAQSGFSEEEVKAGMGLLASTIADPELQGDIAKAGLNTKLAVEAQTELFAKPQTAYFAFSPKFLRGHYKKTVQEAVLEAIRTGLFEYWMYSGLNRDEVSKAMQEGGLLPGDVAEIAGQAAPKGKAPTIGDLKPNQFGGMSVGRNGPLAMMAPPPAGEGYASIKPGEQITPAYARGGGGGGGTQHVVITLDPSARQMFKAEVTNGIYENKRRERNT
jgi:hypothetical protein